jgi:hypothetical protein
MEMAKVSLIKAIRIGELLSHQKPRCGHGNWIPWLEANTPFSWKTANRYIQAYKKRSKLVGADYFESLTEFIEEESRDERREPRHRRTEEEIQAEFQQEWDKEEREELEAEARRAERRKAFLDSGGIIQEFPAYQTEFDQFWAGIKIEYPREKQVEIALELMKYLWLRYPEISGSQFRVVKEDN